MAESAALRLERARSALALAGQAAGAEPAISAPFDADGWKAEPMPGMVG